ncbi:EAL domain-containing protein [Beduini sp.]|uniref:EAL domain-containing protein n=2 Tax=Beduini sp. TaxID=1922300 RepID=UPI003990C221
MRTMKLLFTIFNGIKIVQYNIYIIFLILFLLASIFLMSGCFVQKRRKHLKIQAVQDPITKGISMTAFAQQYEKMVLQSPPFTYTMVFMNMKGFKWINEKFGSEIGDQILFDLYHILETHVYTHEFLCRNNSDCFFLCLKEHEPNKIRQRLTDMIKNINTFSKKTENDYSFYLGAYLIDDLTINARIAQDRSRIACYQKENVNYCYFYEEKLTGQLDREYELNQIFETSLNNHEFILYFQPKIKLSDNSIAGLEALVRWQHPIKGMITPQVFIPLFEKNDKICQLDLFVFEQVCQYLNECQKKQKTMYPISVNLSRAHFKRPYFLDAFSQIKRKYDIPDRWIEFEFTEYTFFDKEQRKTVKKAIEEMHQSGFLCSLDDFGVGFSALALLKDFDVDCIKLDREFFIDIENSKAQTIISGFISIAKELGIKAVAEGIETVDQIAILKQCGCEIVQGYYFASPMPLDQLEVWLENFKPHSL